MKIITTTARHLLRNASRTQTPRLFATATTNADVLHGEKRELKKETKFTWSGLLSFVSPESDFTASADIALAKNAIDHRDDPKEAFLNHMEQNELDRSNLAYSLSFAQAESDYTSLLLTEQMKQQLVSSQPPRSQQQTTEDTLNSPLPKSYREALLPSPQARVITATTSPFSIQHVNSAWEGLCKYSQEESLGKSLKLLQGPETDLTAITALMNQLLKGEEGGCVVVNYDKYGGKFCNRLRVGPLINEQGEITHFVGVLKEVEEQQKKNMMMYRE